MSSPNEDEITVFIETHTQALNGMTNMNDGEVKVIRVKDSCHIWIRVWLDVKWTMIRVWTVIELSVFERRNDLSVVSMEWHNDKYTNINN